MIAHGDHVRPGIQDFLRLVGQHSHHRRVLSVDHGEVGSRLSFQLPQVSAHPV